MEAPFRLRLSLTIQGYKVYLLLQDEARGGRLELLIESIDRGKEGMHVIKWQVLWGDDLGCGNELNN